MSRGSWDCSLHCKGISGEGPSLASSSAQHLSFLDLPEQKKPNVKTQLASRY